MISALSSLHRAAELHRGSNRKTSPGLQDLMSLIVSANRNIKDIVRQNIFYTDFTEINNKINK